MLVLSPKQTDGFHLTLASLPTEERIRLETLLADAVLAVVSAVPGNDFGLCARKVDEIIGTSADDPGTGHLRRGLIATWCLELPRRISAYNLPPEVFDAYPYWLDRLAEALSHDEGAYTAEHWAMDVRFAAGLSVPATRSHLIDLSTRVGVGQSLAHVCDGHGVSPPFRWALAKGWGLWLTVHIDDRDTADFSPDGWDQAWLAVAGVLERYPGLIGAMGGGWIYDPALSRVSPYLAYVRQTPATHGAFLIHQGAGEDHTRKAAARSATRQALIEAGKYRPRSWLMVWARRPLLRWARGARARQARVAAIINQAEDADAFVTLA